MNHRLGFVSIAIVCSMFAACTIGDYKPPSGNGGEGGEGDGGSAGNGGKGGSAGSGGVGGNGGAGGGSAGGGGAGGKGGAGGNGGFGGGLPACEGTGPDCSQHCEGGRLLPAVCKDSGWVCPAGTIDRSICASAGQCCPEGAECPAGTRCINNRCKEKLAAPSCFTDEDCTVSTPHCVGAQVCDCMAQCLVPDQPGTCSP